MSAENLEKCAAVLLDVAGTTTSINFIKETLFPYAVKNAEEYLKANWEVAEVKEAVKAICEGESDPDVAKAVSAFTKVTEEDGENQGAKTLQGLIYKKGYESGDLKAHVFGDVKESLENWAKSRKIGVYSTGSVDSQKLLFSHTTEGDLSASIGNYFDQATVGAKIESASYEKIATELNVKTEEIVFISDNLEEAKAAKTAGCTAVLALREGNPEIKEDDRKDFTAISTFTDLTISAKRKTPDDVTTEAPPSKVAKTEEPKSETAEEGKPEEKKVETEVAEEAMEVDSSEKTEEPVVEKAEEVKEDEKMAEEEKKVEETVVESTTSEGEEKKEVVAEEKMEMEEESKEAEPEKKEESKEEGKTKAEEVVEEKKAAEEEKVEEPTTTSKDVEKKVEEEEKKEDLVEDKKEEEKVESEPKVEEEEKKEEECKAEEKTEVEEVTSKVEEEKVECKAEEKAKEEEKEESKKVEEEEKKEETKSEEKVVENGKEEEEKEKSANGVEEEKENKSEMANGAEKNGDSAKNGVEENGKTEEEEIKVKKIEAEAETATTPPVRVEA